MCLRTFKLVFLMTPFVLGGCVQNYAPSIPDGYSQPIYGVGYAVIEVQNGSSVEEKRLMAVKASKLEAYKSLVEQLYGQYVEVSGQMTNSRIGEEVLDLEERALFMELSWSKLSLSANIVTRQLSGLVATKLTI